jgi:hypothetical protein
MKAICECGREFIKYNTIQSKCPWCTVKSQYKKVPKCKPLKKTVKRKKNAQNKLLDDLWSKAVKILGNNKCVHCGASDGLNSHHIIGRRNFATRWEVKNGVVLCSKCHVFSSKFSAHQTPLSFTRFIIHLKGQEWYDQLEAQCNEIKPDKEKLLKELKEIVYGKEKSLPF